MRINDLEPGTIYEGRHGGARELVSLGGTTCTYREEGIIGLCLSTVIDFACWATRDVTDKVRRVA